jgi:CheY-like chemotaxis protein
MRILVVDDSEEGRDVAEAMLLAAGYEDIITAASAAEAFKLLAIWGPSQEPAPVDLVLLDIVMPEIDGIEACARIRNDPNHADVPIIMVTMLGDMDSLANAFVAGATDYINKPLNRVELLARVRSALKLKSELDRRLARERELLEFISAWGDGKASHWIDGATGLLVAEVAEAYLSAAASFPVTAPSSRSPSTGSMPIENHRAKRWLRASWRRSHARCAPPRRASASLRRLTAAA